jgi:heptaprenylglyceryl phosphate synthase
MPKLYSTIQRKTAQHKKLFAVLIDPDKFASDDLLSLAEDAGVDLLLIGGSILTNGNFEKCVERIKKNRRSHC